MFFFYKQKTAYEMRIRDWSSDVCSSDLEHDACFETCERGPQTGMHAETEREMIACAAAHVVAIGIAVFVRITVRGNDAQADACALGDRLAAHRHVLAGAAHDDLRRAVEAQGFFDRIADQRPELASASCRGRGCQISYI